MKGKERSIPIQMVYRVSAADGFAVPFFFASKYEGN
jgi:hypothetical protein